MVGTVTIERLEEIIVLLKKHRVSTFAADGLSLSFTPEAFEPELTAEELEATKDFEKKSRELLEKNEEDYLYDAVR